LPCEALIVSLIRVVCNWSRLILNGCTHILALKVSICCLDICIEWKTVAL
jgi:hypothetical protein